MGRTLNGPFSEVVGLGNIVWAIVWEPNKATDRGEWSICGGALLERFYCLYEELFPKTR